MSKKTMAPIHPGEILLEEYLEPLGMTPYRLAKSINVPPTRAYNIVHGARSITAGTALRLGKFFGTSPEFWLNLQNHYDIEVERDRAGERIEAEVVTLPHKEHCGVEVALT
jgi:addiction module HigA family antidote